MAFEIERKFLVASTDFLDGISPTHFRQGYLNSDSRRTVRIRVAGEQAMITIKGLNVGMTRPEFEYSIPLADGHQLLELCEPPLIEKNRFLVEFAERTWEVDVFLGDNEGLVVAEIELGHESDQFDPPPWLAEEVTSDSRYFNSNLVAHPYKSWDQ